MASSSSLCGEWCRSAGRVSRVSIICSAVRESVAILRSSRCRRVVSATCMAASSARRTMLFSSRPVASIRMVVWVGLCITAAPSLGLGSILEPSVYTQSSGSHLGVQGAAAGGVCVLGAFGVLGAIGRGSRLG